MQTELEKVHLPPPSTVIYFYLFPAIKCMHPKEFENAIWRHFLACVSLLGFPKTSQKGVMSRHTVQQSGRCLIRAGFKGVSWTV